jgi:hypothetical protein
VCVTPSFILKHSANQRQSVPTAPAVSSVLNT